ncbi:MAG: hypothetical protein ACR2NP_03955 [Pirellulaceae bacterium]
MKLALALCMTLMLTPFAFAQDEATATNDSDIAERVLGMAQGTWELTMERGGQEIYSIKEIEGNKETISRYRDDELIAQWTVDFEVTHANGLNMFTYRNMTFTHGPNEGNTNPGPFSYVFKIHDDEWHEVHGVKQGDSRRPNITVYKKKSDDRP